MFEFEKLELRFYSNKEIAAIAGLDAHDHNFAETMRTCLTRWCYTFEHKRRRGFVITKVPETPEEQLIEILRRELHVDTKQCNALHFASFMSAFVLIPNFFSMPWPNREKLMKEYYDVTVTDRTMMNWRDKLGQCGYLYYSRENRNLWHTFVQDGRKVREPADPESEEYKTYCKLRSVILNGYDAMGIPARSVWGDMVYQLYKEHGVYYYCKSIEFNGIKWKELDYIHDLTLEIIRGKPD